MRANTILITTLAIAAIAVPGAAAAQGFGGPPGFGGPDEIGGPGLPFLEHMLTRIADDLGLTDAQQSQIQAILDEERPAIESMRGQLRDAHQAFRDSHPPGEFDEAAVRAFAESQSQTHVELMVAGARTMSRIHNALTPEQREQLLQMRARHGRRGGPPPERDQELD
jgi:protein CpxP